jgi:glycosyl transferase family 25
MSWWHEETMPLTQFDGIVYINLRRRSDRRASLMKVLEKLHVDFAKVHRIEAVDDPLNGTKGCLLSHIQALDLVQNKGWERGLILEDDVIFHCAVDEIKRVTKTFFEDFKGNWDVFMLGGAYREVYYTFKESIFRIREADRAHAYVVHPDYLPILKECFYQARDIMKDHVFFYDSFPYAVDASWKPLQQKDRWFGPKERLFNQSEGVSDIEHTVKLFRH